MRVYYRCAVILILALAPSLVTGPASSAHAGATLSVTTAADTAPPCQPAAFSLRCALTQANADHSGDTIAFAIPAASPGCRAVAVGGTTVVFCTITVTRALPSLTAAATTIDGYTQSGARPNTHALAAGDNAIIAVRVDGRRAPAGADGLIVTGANDTVRGLSITNFRTLYKPTGFVGGTGVHLIGAGATGDVVSGNFIGLAPDGKTTGPNWLEGVSLDNGASAATIGGTAPPAVNVISGNGNCTGGDCLGLGVNVGTGSGTTIAGNLIGTNLMGTAPISNFATGVVILSPNNTLGGGAVGAGNVIGGNGGDGVLIGAAGNVIAGNLIGTDATGTAKLGNHSHGVDVQVSGNTIGGPSGAAGNVISANGDTGLVLTFGGNVVQGNRIGTDTTGTVALGNGFTPSAIFLGQLINGTDGIVACDGGNTIRNNVISGNAGNGLSLVSSNNVVQGNRIGVNVAGTAALANGVNGIGFGGDPPQTGAAFCQQAPSVGGSNNTIGGAASGAGNIIGGNAGHGISIVLGNNNVIAGNRIGVNAGASATLPNGGDGVFVTGLCNDGTCTGSSANTIGGTSPGAGNIIGGNKGDGVHVDGLGSGANNLVQGNDIGTDPAATAALGNGGAGVFVGDGALNDAIGGTAIGAGNVIAHNGQAGVAVGTGASDTGTHSAIQRNAISANGGLGIDLAPSGVTCAAPGPGPNDDTPCPTIVGATTAQVSGTACANCTVEVYIAAPDADDLGHGEGKTYLGSATAGASGAWSLALSPGQVTVGQQVTASATTAVAFQVPAETSEFAANVTVGP